MGFVLKSNVKKIMLWVIMRIAVTTAIVIGLAYLLSYLAGFSLLELASDLGVEIEAAQIWGYFLVAVGVATVALLLTSYLSAGKGSIVVSEDSLSMDGRPISFDNIARVNFKNAGVSDKLLGTGSISFELTGLKQERVDISFVDEPKSTTQKIHQVLNTHKMRKYARFAEQQKIEKILEPF